jgi:NADPH:quinone reductase-like Zn-dependent oxidoreductase
VVIEVLAVALHPQVRSGASGAHYADDRVLPRSVVADRRRCIPLTADADNAQSAAGMNPATSSWIALRLRAPILPGQRVFILGATGNAGQIESSSCCAQG